MKNRFKIAPSFARRIAWVGLFLVAVGLPAVAQEYSPAPPQQQALGDLCANGIISIRALRFLIVFLLAAIAIFFIQIDLRLGRAGWSLKRALSEPKRLTFAGDQPQQSNYINASNLKFDGFGRPIEVITLEVSISRVIALVGAGSMLIIYLGFGVLSVYHFGRTCSLPPGAAQATGFIWTGLVFFVPYFANKVIFSIGRILDLFSRRGSDYNSIADSCGTSRDDSLQNVKFSARHQPEASPQKLPQTTAQPNTSYLNMPHPDMPHPEVLQIPAIANLDSAAAITNLAPVAEIEEPESIAINESNSSGSNEINNFAYSKAFSLISEFEGFFGQASLTSDVFLGGYVVGYGFTSIYGRSVTKSDNMTQAQADLLLEQGIKSYAIYLASRIPFWPEMTLNQQCALIAFAWNMGASFFEAPGFDVISSFLKLRDWQSVTSAICLYINYGADPIPSLHGRRQAESSLWQAGLIELNDNVSVDPVISSPPLSPVPLNGVAALNEEIVKNEEIGTNGANGSNGAGKASKLYESGLSNQSSTVNGSNGVDGVNKISKSTLDQAPSGLDTNSLSQMDLNYLVNSESKLAIIDKLQTGETAESIQLESYVADRDINTFDGENLSQDLNVAHASNNQLGLDGDFPISISMAGLDSEDQVSALLQPSSQPTQPFKSDSCLAEPNAESRPLGLGISPDGTIFSTLQIHEYSINDSPSIFIESLAIDQPASLETVPVTSLISPIETSPDVLPEISPETSPEISPETSPETSPEISPIASSETSSGNLPQTSPEISGSKRQKKLVVGYFDNLLINGAQNYKDSFSNCCAMLARFWRRIEGANEYNARRESFGSGAVIKSQQDALGSFGLVSEFIDDATVELIKSEIDAARPVAVCWLCYGPFGQPAGGGHWTVVTGYDDNGFFVNDPFGQCDLENGGYSELGNGSNIHYGFENWLPRWTLGGGLGWALTCHSLA